MKWVGCLYQTNQHSASEKPSESPTTTDETTRMMYANEAIMFFEMHCQK
jgi:hypothetical protein